MEKVVFKISGMHCDSCALNIKDTLEDSEFVLAVDVEFEKSKARVLYEEDKISVDEMKAMIKEIGFEAE